MPEMQGKEEHIVFCCMQIRRVKDIKGRREWVRETGMRWDRWEGMASGEWVRLEDTGRVDEEGRPVFEKVDLMEEFFANIYRQVWHRG